MGASRATGWRINKLLPQIVAARRTRWETVLASRKLTQENQDSRPGSVHAGSIPIAAAKLSLFITQTAQVQAAGFLI
ncbi:MAG: hypothetical protein JWQ23_2290 [Herminiimonas sp.]|nr:hypothetical protein [Herminiimonas sp.]